MAEKYLLYWKWTYLQAAKFLSEVHPAANRWEGKVDQRKIIITEQKLYNVKAVLNFATHIVLDFNLIHWKQELIVGIFVRQQFPKFIHTTRCSIICQKNKILKLYKMLKELIEKVKQITRSWPTASKTVSHRASPLISLYLTHFLKGIMAYQHKNIAILQMDHKMIG